MNPTPATVLDLWEAGLQRTPAARALLLLEATGERDVSTWTVGRRDLALLDAYCSGGHGLEALADCPSCGAVLDVAMGVGSFGGGGTEQAVTVVADDYVVTAHPPTVADLMELDPSDDGEALRRCLLTRCVEQAAVGGRAVSVGELPAHVVDQVERALDEADPAADIRLALSCHECDTTWTETLDPVVFAWAAVERAARQLATDVHALAHAYGWSEEQILTLSPFRRHLYLSAVGS